MLCIVLWRLLTSASAVLPCDKGCLSISLDLPARASRSPRVRTITFAPCTCPIYCRIPWLYGASSCLADSPEYDSLTLGSWSSGRGFASSFLQIPPRGQHPCSWIAVGTDVPKNEAVRWTPLSRH